MRFPGIRLVEQPEQKLKKNKKSRSLEQKTLKRKVCFFFKRKTKRKQTSDCNSRALFLNLKAPTKTKVSPASHQVCTTQE